MPICDFSIQDAGGDVQSRSSFHAEMHVGARRGERAEKPANSKRAKDLIDSNRKRQRCFFGRVIHAN